MTTITAKTILRSRHAQIPEKVLSTLLLRYPRWIHAEGRTHRLLEIFEGYGLEVTTPSLMECDDLSRNAASSRAIPVSRMIQDVLDDPAFPLYWGKNQKGMQAAEEMSPENIELAKYIFECAMHDAIGRAKALANLGAHKQLVNRLLEPFSHITVLVSGTEWSNFRALREHKDAEPHIQILAQEIGRELDREDNIQVLQPGEWHLPFISQLDEVEAEKRLAMQGVPRKVPTLYEILMLLIKKSVACCASTSYKTVDGFDMTLEKAIELHDKLVGSAPMHASPAEHVAQADFGYMTTDSGYAEDEYWHWDYPEEFANFQGFRQYRKMLPNECM